ncbi:unnamed protein product [Rotaria sp. Silwood2]|nr:unnamed protein product [Rotaria sp. Silwood2]
MKIRRTKIQAQSITVTAERLSDNSRITFTISSDKTIEHLRSLLNHHLPPYIPNKFCLYSYQRGALIHFHPPSFKLDYFPVIFDQSVLLLKMDDRTVNNIHINNEKELHKEIKRALLPKPSGFLNTVARFQHFLNFLGHLVHLASTRHKHLIAEQLSFLSY